jgi:hypothetical protein
MWAWCNIADHDVAGNYLPGMAALISEYGEGGSKIGTGQGQRELPVSFIFMTGHANRNANTGDGNPMEQAELIINYCKANAQFCLDYYSIDTHDMDDNYYEDTGEDGDSDSYGGNFYQDWQDAHTLGEHYFENKKTPGGIVDYGAHNTQHITANRKGYAMWWILARLAGWDGGATFGLISSGQEDFKIYPNPGTESCFIEAPQGDIREIKLINPQGQVIQADYSPKPDGSKINLDLTSCQPGIYIVQLIGSDQQVYASKLIVE